MLRRLVQLLMAVLFAVSISQAAKCDLNSFMSKPEPAYKWEKTGSEHRDGVTIYSLHMTSQVWHGNTWEHNIQIFRPDDLKFKHFCGLYNTGGSGSNDNTMMGIHLAKASHATYAILFGIPMQPLYGGKTEDALVVYTWLKFMETGDESWPLHFPMAKSVLKAMDAIQAFTTSEKLPALNDFVVSGASKRGWTTWLVGASKDPRVKAIIPMVIDVLNVRKQGRHQLEAYGAPSVEVGDYTQANIFAKLETPEGKRLLELEDPYSYKDIITIPKLLILGTNDPYWTQDALNIYWDELKGPKYVLYAPNSGHGLNDRERVYNTMAAFYRHIAGHTKWPKQTWSYSVKPDGVGLTYSSNIAPKSARLFHVTSTTQDFRDQHWTSDEVPVSGDGYTAQMAAPATGYETIYGEATYNLDGDPFTLSTQVHILGIKK